MSQKTRQDTKRALKHGVAVRRQGYAGVVDLSYKGKRYSSRMDMHGVDSRMMKE